MGANEQTREGCKAIPPVRCLFKEKPGVRLEEGWPRGVGITTHFPSDHNGNGPKGTKETRGEALVFEASRPE